MVHTICFLFVLDTATQCGTRISDDRSARGREADSRRVERNRKHELLRHQMSASCYESLTYLENMTIPRYSRHLDFFLLICFVCASSYIPKRNASRRKKNQRIKRLFSFIFYTVSVFLHTLSEASRGRIYTTTGKISTNFGYAELSQGQNIFIMCKNELIVVINYIKESQ